MTHNRIVEAELRRWLRDHHSVIAWEEARQLGASKPQVLKKVKRGEWDRVYRNVFRDAAASPAPHRALRAAFVATGERGVISYASAAWMWNLLPEPPEVVELSITPGPGDIRRMPGVILHRTRDLALSHHVHRRTLVVTNPLRTLVDLAGVAPLATLTKAVDTALASGMLTTDGLLAEIGRLSRPGRPGPGALRDHLSDRGFIGAPEASV